MIESEAFAKSGVCRRILGGELDLRCEWCGCDLLEDEPADAEEVLLRVRDHALTCSLSSRAPMDEKEIAKGVLGWLCEWCGEEKIDKSFMGAAKKVKAAREHSQHCRCSPLVGEKG